MQPPVVSVIMAVRDGQQWLSQAIDSILTQTFSDFELLVIDDGSIDQTPEILAGYRARDQRLIVLTQAREGLVCALNRGLNAARGTLIARLDADDIALPDRLLAQTRFFRGHPDVVLLGAWAQVIDEQGQPKPKQLRPPTDRDKLARALAKQNPFIHSTVMFRTAAARDLGGYRRAFEAAEDYDLWLRLADKGEFAILPEVQIQYRQHDKNVTKTKALRQLFSARLARLSRESRRTQGVDPASALTAPPEWNRQSEGAFCDEWSRIYRLLELADPAIAREANPSSIDLRAISGQLSDLMPGERKFAQQALVNLLRNRVRPPGQSRWLLLALLFRLHPTRALRLLWRS